MYVCSWRHVDARSTLRIDMCNVGRLRYLAVACGTIDVSRMYDGGMCLGGDCVCLGPTFGPVVRADGRVTGAGALGTFKVDGSTACAAMGVMGIDRGRYWSLDSLT